MSKFVRTIDWELLRKQKDILTKVLYKRELKDEEQNGLNGIIHLLDALQDWAVDEEGAAEELVFGSQEEVDRTNTICITCGKATDTASLLCEGGHILMGVQVEHQKLLPEWWEKAKTVFGMDDETLKTYIENQVSIVILNRRK